MIKYLCLGKLLSRSRSYSFFKVHRRGKYSWRSQVRADEATNLGDRPDRFSSHPDSSLFVFFKYTPQDDHAATVLNFRWYDQLHPQQSQHLHHSSVHGGRGWNNPSTTNCLIIQLIKFDHLINLQAQIDQIDQEVEFSIVHNPILKQTWTARKGQGAFCNGKRIKVLAFGTHCLP